MQGRWGLGWALLTGHAGAAWGHGGKRLSLRLVPSWPCSPLRSFPAQLAEAGGVFRGRKRARAYYWTFKLKTIPWNLLVGQRGLGHGWVHPPRDHPHRAPDSEIQRGQEHTEQARGGRQSTLSLFTPQEHKLSHEVQNTGLLVKCEERRTLSVKIHPHKTRMRKPRTKSPLSKRKTRWECRQSETTG